MANLQTGKIDQLLDDLKTSANEQIKKSRLMAIFLDRWLRLIWLWVFPIWDPSAEIAFK
nr:hypothetical protein [Nitrosomonas nitrosa]